jgi:formate--tetrahydrofolate ligase
MRIVQDRDLSAGAGFVVVLLGKIMTMPGLPRDPAGGRIRFDADGHPVGLMQGE